MDDYQKQKIFLQLILLRNKLCSAQLQHESVYMLGYRIRTIISDYINLGKTTRGKFDKITQTPRERELTALISFMSGLNEKINR